MSNERIEQIINQMWDAMPFARALYAQPYIREAMGQYGKEQYVDGCRTTNKKYELILTDAGEIASENIRLRQLVQAQKEYIELLHTDGVFGANWAEGIELRALELRAQIKELES